MLTTGLCRSINAAARDLDGDGIPEIALAHEFGTTHASSLGILSLLTHESDPTEPWRIREVDRTPTVHRIRWADADGTGRPVLVSAPLSGPAAEPPEYRDAVPVYWYRPDDCTRRTVTNDGLGVVHGLLVKPWSDAPGDAVFTASFAGVHVHRYLDGEWSRETVAAGALDPWPQSGSSEVEVGRLGERDFVATIEPWHGPQVVVYREEAGSWERQVIDEIGSGHTIVTADFNDDGRDEICHRGPRRYAPPPSLRGDRRGRRGVVAAGARRRHVPVGMRGSRSERRCPHRLGLHRRSHRQPQVVRERLAVSSSIP